jgi:hypothetical protein
MVLEMVGSGERCPTVLKLAFERTSIRVDSVVHCKIIVGVETCPTDVALVLPSVDVTFLVCDKVT